LKLPGVLVLPKVLLDPRCSAVGKSLKPARDEVVAVIG